MPCVFVFIGGCSYLIQNTVRTGSRFVYYVLIPETVFHMTVPTAYSLVFFSNAVLLRAAFKARI